MLFVPTGKIQGQPKGGGQGSIVAFVLPWTEDIKSKRSVYKIQSNAITSKGWNWYPLYSWKLFLSLLNMKMYLWCLQWSVQAVQSEINGGDETMYFCSLVSVRNLTETIIIRPPRTTKYLINLHGKWNIFNNNNSSIFFLLLLAYLTVDYY